MSEVTSNNNKPRLHPIVDFKHYWKMLPNRAYAINLVDAAISRKQYSINLDPKRLTHKVYSGTSCTLLDREGNGLTINVQVTNIDMTSKDWVYIKSNMTQPIDGCSRPQHEDRFSKFEGRKQALISALSKLNFKECDDNYKELLDVKLFLKQFELNSNIENVSWEFMDLWNAFLFDLCNKTNTSYKSPNYLISLEQAAINYVGLLAYENYFKGSLEQLLINLSDCFQELGFIDVYSIFNYKIKNIEDANR